MREWGGWERGGGKGFGGEVGERENLLILQQTFKIRLVWRERGEEENGADITA